MPVSMYPWIRSKRGDESLRLPLLNSRQGPLSILAEATVPGLGSHGTAEAFCRIVPDIGFGDRVAATARCRQASAYRHNASRAKYSSVCGIETQDCVSR